VHWPPERANVDAHALRRAPTFLFIFLFAFWLGDRIGLGFGIGFRFWFARVQISAMDSERDEGALMRALYAECASLSAIPMLAMRTLRLNVVLRSIGIVFESPEFYARTWRYDVLYYAGTLGVAIAILRAAKYILPRGAPRLQGVGARGQTA
jgi:hypothetical protein